ncbi:MAG TPA: amidohydrolase family protein [Candidatus Paceibacterota bacterium]|nr:amidohydrolase family protein [Candidatus Paceibacterota bacterium]
MNLNRRQFIQAATGLAACVCAAETSEVQPVEIIDTHTHFYDPMRSQGVPWPPKDDALLYRTVLPKDYRALPVPQPVKGTVVVEASHWIEDNQWILDLAAQDPFIMGLVGNLPIGTPEFGALLTRFAAQPLFRGVRIREGSFEKLLSEPAFVKDLHAVSDHGLCFEVHSPREWVGQAVRLARRVPSLRLIINHVANAQVTGKKPADDWCRMIDGLSEHPQVFMKVSGLVEGTDRRNGDAPEEIEFYRPVLDKLWKAFGPDRLLYGSNWPVSERFAPLGRVERIALRYFSEKGQATIDKVFSKNARVAYGLHPGKQK